MAEDYPVNIVFDAVDRVTASMRRINSRIERMTGPFRRLNNSFRALGRESGLIRLQESLGRVSSATGRVVRQIGALGKKLGVLGTIAGVGLFKIVRDTTRAGDEVSKFARRVGVSVEWLQEMQFVAERSGVKIESFNMAVQRAGRRIGEFVAMGRGEAAPVLEGMGFTREQLKNLGSIDNILPLVLDKLSKIENANVRNAAAMKLFDSEGVAVVQMLEDGVQGIDALRAEARRLGLVLSEDAARGSERFEDKFTNLMSSLAGARNVIGVALLPVLSDLIDRMTTFFIENRPQIQAWAEEFATRIPSALTDLRDGAMSLLNRLQPLIDAVQWLFDTFGTGETILTALAVVIGGPLIAAVGSLATAVIGLGAAIGFTPIGWFLAAIAALAAAVWGASKAVDYVRDTWPGVWQVISDAIGIVVDSIGILFDLLTGDFDAVAARFKRIAETISNAWSDVWGGIKAGAQAFWNWMKPWLAKMQPVIDAMLAPIKLAVQGAQTLARWTGMGGDDQGARGAIQSSTQTQRRESRVTVDLQGLPRGARVQQQGDVTDDIDLSMGWSMMAAP